MVEYEYFCQVYQYAVVLLLSLVFVFIDVLQVAELCQTLVESVPTVVSISVVVEVNTTGIVLVAACLGILAKDVVPCVHAPVGVECIVATIFVVECTGHQC